MNENCLKLKQTDRPISASFIFLEKGLEFSFGFYFGCLEAVGRGRGLLQKTDNHKTISLLRLSQT